MGIKVVRIVLIGSLLLCVTSIFAWDEVGHKTTAYIAWQSMSPKAREQAIRILLAAPEDSHLSVFFQKYDSRSLEVRQIEFFMMASIWPDVVRDKNFPLRYQKYNKPEWHYFDKFWKFEGNSIKLLPKPDSSEGGKALEKLFEFERILKDRNAADSEKAIALAWFLHVAGDIHQPLHNSARVSSETPNGDQGGNLFLLTPKNTPKEKQDNLHWFWDSIIVRSIPRGDSCDLTFIGDLARNLMKKYPLEQLKGSLYLGKYDRWHEEAFEIATKEVFSETLKPYELPSEEYRKKALEISEKQITLAGYRIGSMLNEILN